MIRAVIFDMDGLLVDTEPLWDEAAVATFRGVGIPMTLEMARITVGLRSDEVVAYWHQRHPWPAPSLAEVNHQFVNRVLDLVKQKMVALPGVAHVIDLANSLDLAMGIASSSQEILIHTVVEKLGIGHHLQVMHSAEFEELGKPDPAVYLTAAAKLGVAPEECVALEDSGHGVQAAKSAGMRCIAIPSEHTYRDPRIQTADVRLDSLLQVTTEHLSGAAGGG